MNKSTQTLKETFFTAVESYNKKDFKNAEALCYKILSIDPNHSDSIFLLANISASNRNFTDAAELLLKGIKQQPKNTSALNNLGTAYKELGKIDISISYYEKVLTIDPNNTNANYNLGAVYYSLRQLDKAKNYLEKTVKIQPNFAFAFFSLGNVQSELKEYEDAKLSYQKAIKLREDFTGAYNNLGLVYRLLNNYPEAEKCYKKTIEINPKHVGAYNNLGRLFTELGKFKDAIKCHEKAIEIEPENLYQYFYLSELKEDFLNLKIKNKIEKTIKKEEITNANLAFGNFLLSKYEKKEKNYKKEFDYLITAHDNYFKTKKEKFELGVKYCFNDVLQISSSLDVDGAIKSNENFNIKPIFIIGVPRCGSTLVEKVLGAGKKKISMGEESAIIENFVNKKILEKKSLNLGKAQIIRDEIVEIYKEKGLVNSKNGFIFSDKSLNNFFYIKFIKKIFPQAKVINCKRDNLASIVSIFQNNLTELAWAHNLENIFKYFNNYYETMEKNKTKYGDFIYDLEFEKFIADPIIESKNLMKFCELPWDKKCLEFYKKKDVISKTTSYLQVRKAIYKHPKNRYLPYKQFLDQYGKKYSWFH